MKNIKKQTVVEGPPQEKDALQRVAAVVGELDRPSGLRRGGEPYDPLDLGIPADLAVAEEPTQERIHVEGAGTFGLDDETADDKLDISEEEVQAVMRALAEGDASHIGETMPLPGIDDDALPDAKLQELLAVKAEAFDPSLDVSSWRLPNGLWNLKRAAKLYCQADFLETAVGERFLRYMSVHWDHEFQAALLRAGGVSSNGISYEIMSGEGTTFMGKTLWEASLNEASLRDSGTYVKEYRKDRCSGAEVGLGGDEDKPYFFKMSDTPVRIRRVVKDSMDRPASKSKTTRVLDATTAPKTTYVEVEFFNRCGEDSGWAMAKIGLASIQSERSSLMEILANSGISLSVSAKAKALFKEFLVNSISLLSTLPEFTVSGRTRAGWAKIRRKENGAEKEKLAYVGPGFQTHESLRFTGHETVRWQTAGDEQLYLRAFANFLARGQDSPRAALLCGFFAAGLLRRHIGLTDFNPIWMIQGDAAGGKTTALWTAQSMIGHPKPNSATGTVNGIEQLVIGFNDVGGCLDEVGMARESVAKEAGRLIYAFSSGDEAIKMQQHKTADGSKKYSVAATGLDNASLLTLMMSGEKSFFDSVHAATGQQIRYTSLVFERGTYPIWGFVDDNRIKVWRNRLIKENHGWLYPRMVNCIIRDYENQRAKIEAAGGEDLADIDSVKDNAALDVFEKVAQKSAQRVRDTILKVYPNLTDDELTPIWRKQNSFAYAMTGVYLIYEALEDIRDEQGNRLFSMDFVMKCHKEALEMVKLDLLKNPLRVNSVRFYDFLTDFYSSNKSVMLNLDAQDEDTQGREIVGVYASKVNKAEKTITHTMQIKASELDSYCRKKDVSTRDFLQWALSSKYLAEGGDKDHPNQKRSSSFPGSRTWVYQFTWQDTLVQENLI